MVVTIKIPSILHQNFSRCDVDIPIVSFNFVPNLGFTLRVGELVVDAQCDLPLFSPYNFLLKMM